MKRPNRTTPPLNRTLVTLAVLVTAVLLAAPAPAGAGTKSTDPSNSGTTNAQAADQGVTRQYRIIRNGKPIYRKTINVNSNTSRRVSSDDYERVLRTVGQKRSMRTIWLGNINRSPDRPRPKTTWLGKKKPAE